MTVETSLRDRRQRALSRKTTRAAIRLWRRIDRSNIRGSWPLVKVPLLVLLRQAQRESALIAAEALSADINPDAWVGLASDGRDLSGLLDSVPYRALHTLGEGGTPAEALKSGDGMAAVITRTQVADTSRSVTQTAMAADTRIRGYVRTVSLPACARCIILAGRLYRWSDGFLRHPGCDCSMQPVTYDDWDEIEPQDPEALIAQMRKEHPARLMKSLSEGDLKALDHGADLNQVVNAHKGVYRAAPFGREVQATREGVTRRGYAGNRMKGSRSPRLMPDEIFQAAERNHWPRDEVVRQLERFGYI